MLFLISIPSWPLWSATTIVCWRTAFPKPTISRFLAMGFLQVSINLHQVPIQIFPPASVHLHIPDQMRKASTLAKLHAHSQHMMDMPRLSHHTCNTTHHNNTNNDIPSDVNHPSLTILQYR